MFELIKSLFKPKKQFRGQNATEKIIYSNDTFSLTSKIIINIDEERYKKERLASKLKKEGKIDKACEILYSLKDKYNTDTRLALYLQQAGKFKESKKEFEELIYNAPLYYKIGFSHQNSEVQNGLLLHHYSTVFDKLRLTYQREKQYKEILYFGLMKIVLKFLAMKIQKRLEENSIYLFNEEVTREIEILIKKSKLKERVNKDMILFDIKSTDFDLINFSYFNKKLSEDTNTECWKIYFI